MHIYADYRICKRTLLIAKQSKSDKRRLQMTTNASECWACKSSENYVHTIYNNYNYERGTKGPHHQLQDKTHSLNRIHWCRAPAHISDRAHAR